MGGIFGGGGSGRSKTEAEAQYPPEFRPLASSSVKQIQAAQEALPLAGFTSPQPQQVAGLAPFTVAGMELIPGLTQASPAEQSLMGLGPVWQDLMNRAASFQPSPTIGQSTDFLLGTLGLPGSGGTTGGGAAAPAAAPAQLPFQQVPPLGNVFGGGPVPMPSITNTGASVPISPLMPTAPIPPPVAPVAAAGGPGATFGGMTPQQMLEYAAFQRYVTPEQYMRSPEEAAAIYNAYQGAP